VVEALLTQVPGQEILYYGDTARAPYGNRSAETIVQWSLEGAQRLGRSGAQVWSLPVTRYPLWPSMSWREVLAVRSSMRRRRPLRWRSKAPAGRPSAWSPRARPWKAALRGADSPPPVLRPRSSRRIAPVGSAGGGGVDEAARDGADRQAWPARDQATPGGHPDSREQLFRCAAARHSAQNRPQVTLVEVSARLAARVAEHLKTASALSGRRPAAERSGFLVSDLTPQVVQAARMICGRTVELEKAV